MLIAVRRIIISTHYVYLLILSIVYSRIYVNFMAVRICIEKPNYALFLPKKNQKKKDKGFALFAFKKYYLQRKREGFAQCH